VNRRSTPAILDEVERAIAPVMQQRAGIQPAFQRLVPSEEREGAPAVHAAPRACVEHWISWEWEGGSARAPSAERAARLEAAAIASDLVGLRRAGELPGWSGAGVLLRTRGHLEHYLRRCARRACRTPSNATAAISAGAG
jgi:hypothetical protein